MTTKYNLPPRVIYLFIDILDKLDLSTLFDDSGSTDIPTFVKTVISSIKSCNEELDELVSISLKINPDELQNMTYTQYLATIEGVFFAIEKDDELKKLVLIQKLMNFFSRKNEEKTTLQASTPLLAQ